MCAVLIFLRRHAEHCHACMCMRICIYMYCNSFLVCIYVLYCMYMHVYSCNACQNACLVGTVRPYVNINLCRTMGLPACGPFMTWVGNRYPLSLSHCVVIHAGHQRGLLGVIGVHAFEQRHHALLNSGHRGDDLGQLVDLVAEFVQVLLHPVESWFFGHPSLLRLRGPRHVVWEAGL